MVALTISQYNGFFKRVEELLQIYSCFFSHSMKQRVLGVHAPQIFRISSHFALWEAVSQRKYCCLKSNILDPQKNLGWQRQSHCIAASPVRDVWGQESHVEKRTIVTWSEPLKICCHVIVTQRRATAEQCARKFRNVWVCRRKETWVNCKLITASHQNNESGSCAVWMPYR